MEIMKGKNFGGQIPFKKVDRSKQNNVTKKVDGVILYIATNSITDTNNFIRATEVPGGNRKRRRNNKAQQKTRQIGIFKGLLYNSNVSLLHATSSGNK